MEVKQKLSPQQRDPPTAMHDMNSKLLTVDKDIRDEAVKHFQTGFETKLVYTDLKDHYD